MKDKKNRVLLRTVASVVPAVPEMTAEEPLMEDHAYVVTQPDLLTLESVLVSTGFNDNDDVFLSEELIGARGTGRHKPVNIEHEDSNIVGHMTESFVATKTGERINEEVILGDPDSLPANFDLVSRAVVYASIFPELAHEIRERAAHNELFVSVEAWFEDYDYIVGSRIVRRNADTQAKLDPVLRINGGKGQVNGQRLGRVLRGLVIGGKGLVSVPANPDSVIRSVSSCDLNGIEQLLEDNTIGSFVDNSFVPLEKETVESIETEEGCMKSKAAKKKKKEDEEVKPEAAEEKVDEKVDTEQESDATHHDEKKKKKKQKDARKSKEDDCKDKVKADDEETQDETSESSDTATATEEPKDKEEAKDEDADDTPADEQEQPESKAETKEDPWGEKLQEMADRLATLEKTSEKQIGDLKSLVDSKDETIDQLNRRIETLEKPAESEATDSADTEEPQDDQPKDEDKQTEISEDIDIDDAAIDDAIDDALDTAEKDEDPLDFSSGQEDVDEELQEEFKDVLIKLGMMSGEEESEKGGS